MPYHLPPSISNPLNVTGTLRVMILTAALVLLFSAPSPQPAHADDSLPYAQPGPYAVGVREITVSDDSGRSIDVAVWYPAIADGAEAATYREGLFPIEGTALRDAAPDTSGGPYPVVVFSHGSGSSRWLSLFYTEHLPSHGFVVVAPVHAGNTLLDTLAVDEFIDTVVSGYVTRPLDVMQTLDAVESLDWLAGTADMERVALTGHSFGGYTALAAAGATWDFAGLQAWCEANAGGDLDPVPNSPVTIAPSAPDNSYGACFLLDHNLEPLPEVQREIDALVIFAPWNGPVWGDAGLENVTAPTLVMIGTADRVTLPLRDAYRIHRNLGGDQKTLVTFAGADHFIFLDDCSPFFTLSGFDWLCTDPAWEMDAAHAVINHLTTAFLRSVLYDEIDAALAFTATEVEDVVISGR